MFTHSEPGYGSAFSPLPAPARDDHSSYHRIWHLLVVSHKLPPAPGISHLASCRCVWSPQLLFGAPWLSVFRQPSGCDFLITQWSAMCMEGVLQRSCYLMKAMEKLIINFRNVHEISDISEMSMTFQKSLTSASASACFVGAPQAMCESTTIKVGLSCLVSLEAKTVWIFPTIGASRKIPSALTPHFLYLNLNGLTLGGIPFSDTWVSNSRLKLRKARVRAWLQNDHLPKWFQILKQNDQCVSYLSEKIRLLEMN